MANEKCVWVGDEEEATYETSCGHAFTLINGTLVDNETRFCCYCGKEIEEKFTQEQYLMARW